MIVLTSAEQAQLQIWIADTASVAAKSTLKRLSKNPPKIEVIEVPQNSLGWEAKSSGGKISISRDCLGAPLAIRRYLIAHELGHEEGHHPLISVTAALLAFTPVLVVAARPFQWFPQTLPFISWMVLGIGFVLGVIGIVLYKASMIYEWDADRRAVCMVGLPTMVQGATLIQSKRKNANKFYQNKIAKLSGGSPSLWML